LIFSEYGESWHEGGMLLNKQNVFDDFASAAEYLIANKYTRRDRYFNNQFETHSI
jgi:prolyl oligopeptidase